MNYYEIGQRIRKFRKAYNLSQEQLAEMVQISTTHMSHIETGNTKLSLPVLVDIAEALSVQTDELLYDTPPYNKTGMKQEINELLDSCSTRETRILLDILKAVRVSLAKYEPDMENSENSRQHSLSKNEEESEESKEEPFFSM